MTHTHIHTSCCSRLTEMPPSSAHLRDSRTNKERRARQRVRAHAGRVGRVDQNRAHCRKNHVSVGADLLFVIRRDVV